MKDYGRILESARKNSLQKIVKLKAGNGVSEWNALQLIEEMSGKMRHRLRSVMDPQWDDIITNVKLELFANPRPNTTLLLKAQLYRLSTKELILKVFAHEIGEKGQASKLARASYHISLVYKPNSGMVA